jgi:zinc-ribbon domain
MFCQKCGAELLNATKFCVKCGYRLREARISNKAILLAGIAAVVSVGSALLSFLPRSGPATIQEPIVMAGPSPGESPTPRSSPMPKTRQTPEPTLKPKPRQEPTPDYPYRHAPTLIYPDDGAFFSYIYSSGKIKFQWKEIAGSKADQYKLEVECGNPAHYPPWLLREYETPWNYRTVNFAGAPSMEIAGRWRVTPVLADGHSGVSTEWRTFRFTK